MLKSPARRATQCGRSSLEAREESVSSRKQSRVDLYMRLPVYRDEQTEPLGYMQNMSTGGLMVVSDQLIPLNERLVLRMGLPETMNGVTEIQFRAHAVWQETDANPQLTTTGFEYDDVAFADYQIIIALIPRYCVPELSGEEADRAQ